MRPSEALAKNRDKVLEILSRFPVRNPRIFGSTARGEDTEDSDLDIMVEHDGGISYFDIARAEIQLEALLKIRVGVHLPGEFLQKASQRVNRDLRAF